MLRSALAAILSSLIFAGCATPAAAEPIFADGFQDGEANGWGAAGDGGISLTTFQGNVSLRLEKKAAAFAAITTSGYEQVSVSGSFAASDLERGDACILDASIDNGSNWISILEVRDGQDDGVTLHGANVTSPYFDDLPRLILRARIAGDSDSDICWFDNISVTGRWLSDVANQIQFFDPDFLNGNASLKRPASTGAFAPLVDAEDATADFRGRLIFKGSDSRGGFEILRDRLNFAVLENTKMDMLPDFDFELVSRDGVLLPEKRGLIANDHPFWEYVLTPGKVWHESGEGDWNRAALPFALIEKNANCTHNGLLTFLYSANGDISRLAYQISSETCAYFQFDAWGLVDAKYVTDDLAATADLFNAYAREVAARLQTRPIEELANRFPGIDLSGFGSPDDVKPNAMTSFGVVLDGFQYVGGCETRYGPYPYCDSLVIPSYSFAKSIFAGFALMRMEELYPGARNALISDYVPECAAEGGWDGVTFEHALDMVTGRYIETTPDADENAAVQADFFIVETHAEKIALACGRYPRREAAGTTFVYHTTDTYLLGAAMAEFLRERAGKRADLYETLIVAPLWEPLGLSPTLRTTRRTYDAVAQPFTGWGLVMQRGDLAKILAFLSERSGEIGGEQVLDPALLRGALQEEAGDRGHQAGSPDFKYNNGFWGWNYRDFGSCEDDVWIPFLSGFGGLSAVLLPNGAAYYYVSDDYEFAWGRAVKASGAIGQVCGERK